MTQTKVFVALALAASGVNIPSENDTQGQRQALALKLNIIGLTKSVHSKLSMSAFRGGKKLTT